MLPAAPSITATSTLPPMISSLLFHAAQRSSGFGVLGAGCGLLDVLRCSALLLLRHVVISPTRGLFTPRTRSSVDAAENGELIQVFAVTFVKRHNVQHQRNEPGGGGEDRRQGGQIHPFDGRRAERGGRHRRAGVAGSDEGIGLAVFGPGLCATDQSNFWRSGGGLQSASAMPLPSIASISGREPPESAGRRASGFPAIGRIFGCQRRPPG